MLKDRKDAELFFNLRIFSYQNPVPSYFNKATPEKPAFWHTLLLQYLRGSVPPQSK